MKVPKTIINTMLWPIVPAILIGYYFLGMENYPTIPKINDEEWWGPHPVVKLHCMDSINPYKVQFSDVIVNDLKERLLHRRPFTPPLENTGFKYGFNSEFMTMVLDFWQNSYNFKDRENYLNKYKHYTTNIQGLDIHYIRAQPEAPPGFVKIPILLIHGWPSSIREFYDVIPLLTSHQANQNFVFEVIVPSLPGYGFSQAPTRQGMGPIETAVILHNLMKRIGHNHYFIHGSNFGYTVGSVMATVFPNNVLGIHFNKPSSISDTESYVFKILDYLWPSAEPAFIEDQCNRLRQRRLEASGHINFMQPNKPDTLGIALSESPAGLAAYILEQFSQLPESQASDGGILNKFSLTHLLDNVMIYWVKNSMTTSLRHYSNYYYNMAVIDEHSTEVPAWYINFSQHQFKYPKNKYNLLGMTVVQRNTRNPAMEYPELLAADIRKSVAAFRLFHQMYKSQQGSPEMT